MLAGGLGTRLSGVIDGLPKILAPVGRRPFLELLVDRLHEAGVTDVVLSLGHGADAVIDAVGRLRSPSRVRYVQETNLLGTGGAIAFAEDSLGLDEILVANGDTYLQGDLSAMLEPLDAAAGELFRMAAVRVPDRARFGGVDVDASQRVKGFLEKGEGGSGLINAGLYRLRRAALPAQRAGAYSLENDVLPELVRAGKVSARILDATFIDIGVPEDYRRFCEQYAA